MASESTNRRHWLMVTAGIITLALLAAAAGWGLSGLVTSRNTASPTEVNADQALTPEQAKDQACNAFRVASRQWTKAYREWLPAVSVPGWQWSDPAVLEATALFSEREAEIVAQLDSLIAPTTPLDVAQAIRGYTGALLAYSAGHGLRSDPEMDDQEREIDDAADAAVMACA